MKRNLTSPRYRHTIDLEAFNGIDASFIRSGILPISPGQWVTYDGGKTKARFVKVAGSSIWLVHPKNGKVSTLRFSQACKTWLAN